jgi:nucleoside-diphosphate-sugar epimerase
MKHTLITGAAGFIGTHLSKKLLQEGHAVYAVDNFITGHPENLTPLLQSKNFHFLQEDITHASFQRTFLNVPLDQIYHLACPTGVPNIQLLAQEMLETCSIGTRNILEIARTHNASLIFTSSCEVYGDPERFPQQESYTGNVDPIGLRSPYEEGKRFSEALLMMYVRKYNLAARITRFFNIYGPGMSLKDHRVIPQFLHSITNKKPLSIYGDGEQKRTFLYVNDAIAGLQLVMDQGIPGEAYNMGSTHQTTIRELGELLLSFIEHKQEIQFQPHFIEDHHARLPSTEKLEKLGWRQKISLQEGLQRVLHAYGVPLDQHIRKFSLQEQLNSVDTP